MKFFFLPVKVQHLQPSASQATMVNTTWPKDHSDACTQAYNVWAFGNPELVNQVKDVQVSWATPYEGVMTIFYS